MKVLLTGCQGQLGLALQAQLGDSCELLALPRAELDLSRPQQIREQLRRHRPQLVINAAAYTAVDAAQNDREAAWAINAVAPGVLAEEAAQLGAVLIHYSTDYVFDGRKATPYREDDRPAPLNVYGESKLAGEQAIRAVAAAHLILRTSWVYSLQGSNFLLSMLRLLQSRSELRVVADQVGAPTWSVHLAQASRQLMERCQAGTPGPWGLYHLSAGGATSWFGFAAAIADSLRARGLPCARLEPISSAEYPSAAQRPANSRLDCSRLQQAWGVHLPAWQQGLAECLAGHDPNVARQGHG